MVRFIERIKFNPIFAKAVYDAFYDPEKEKFDFYGRRFQYKNKFDGWPDKLDMENFDIVHIGGDDLVFQSGGDWQHPASVGLSLKRNSHTLIWNPFEAYSHNSDAEIKLGLQDLISCVQSLDEDCQIAGPMMGDLPPHVGSTLSLGYKNGRVLSPPKKRTNSQDYDSIPDF
jgi:hypothetical protein